MNERAQERCRRVTCTCHVGWKLPLEIPQSSTLKLESPYSSQDPKKRWSVQWRTCTDTPIALSKPHTYHIGLCSRSKFEHNQFSRSQYIEVGCARAHVHSDTLWACRSHITNWSLPTGMFTKNWHICFTIFTEPNVARMNLRIPNDSAIDGILFNRRLNYAIPIYQPLQDIFDMPSFLAKLRSTRRRRILIVFRHVSPDPARAAAPTDLLNCVMIL